MSTPSEPSVQPLANASAGRFKFSVIIPARNEEEFIGRCCESLAGLDYPRDGFEVIVVDNGSADRTMEIARSFGSELNVTVLEKHACHISAVRNFGAAAARGELLAFLDADCLPSPAWLREAARLLAERGGIVGAHVAIPRDSTWLARVWYDDPTQNRRPVTSYVPTGDMLMSRADFVRIGGFDETLETNEDYEICQRAKAAGLSVRAVPCLEVIHLRTPQTLRAFFGKERWHGTHVLRVFLSNIWALPNARAVFYALYTLACLVGAAVGVVRAIAFGRLDLLGVSVAALLIAPLALAVRSAAVRKRWTIIPGAALLYLLFGIARATCVLDPRCWSSARPSTPENPGVGSRAATDRAAGRQEL